MNILELIKESHGLAKEKGFWENNKNRHEDIMFIIANLGEVAKTHRKKKFANWTLYNDSLKNIPSSNLSKENTKSFNNYFQVFIKDTFEDEITNVILRITDFIGGNNINIIKSNEWIEKYVQMDLDDFFRSVAPSEKYCGNIGEWMNKAVIERVYRSNESDMGLMHILFYLGSIIEEFNIDIEKYIVTKIEFNRTRPVMYGREY
jgi:hypothetical protein